MTSRKRTRPTATPPTCARCSNFALFHARLLHGDKALAHLTSLVTDASEANLMSDSVGGVAGAVQNIYSFDGNAGGTAAIHPARTTTQRIRYHDQTTELILSQDEPITLRASS